MGCAKWRSKPQPPGVGGWIVVGRESRGLTVEDLARRLGAPVERIRAIEKNAPAPTERQLKLIAYNLNLPVHFFTRPTLRHEPECNRWIHGDGVVMCASCLYIADYLCDFPMGKGQTCDAPLCEEHANVHDKDLHFCPQHEVIATKMAVDLSTRLDK